MGHRVLRRGAIVILCLFLLLGSIPPVRAAEECIHILLIGLDRRPGEKGCRSDTILLCSYQIGTGELTMTSFLRDLYVSIPGHGSNRINAAYALGGRKLLDKTLEHNFGITVEGNVEVDFSQFAALIDALGGVTLELRQDEANRINRDCHGSSLGAGEQLLTGQQALCYSRIRNLDSDGDFSRTLRQQAVLRAMLKRWKDADLSTLLTTVNEVLPMISTDLSPVQILNWVFTAAPERASIQVNSLRIPAPGTYRSSTVRGMSVLLPDLEANREVLRSVLEK